MTLIAPSTDIYLLKLPIELDDENQLTFASASAQATYFQSLAKIQLDDGTYQRRDDAIRYPGTLDSIIQYNYCMYKNAGHGSKWFYARIKNMAYVNDNLTLVEIEEDAFQTWQFDLIYNQCFVEREHVTDDTIGSNTIPEGLELGEYTINSSTTLKPDKITTPSGTGESAITRTYPIFFQVSKLASGISIAASQFENSYNGIFSGLFFFAVTSEAAARWVINQYAVSPNSQGDIVSIFLAPKEFLEGCFHFGELTHDIYIPKNQSGISHLLEASSATITRPATLDGYTPKNNKMFCWPFSLVSVTNNAGVDTEFRFEDFASATPKFFMGGSLGQGCTVKLCPVDYKKSATGAERFDYGVTGAKYPICAWATDYYTNWCTQNSVNIGTSLASNVVKTAASVAATGVVGGAISIGTQIASLMAQNYEAKVHPNQAQGNVNASDVLIAWQRYYTVNCMSVRYEFARSIDEYLSAFGYKVNRVKVPNTTGRTYWNYVKTVGSAVHGYIPQDSVDRINGMFDNGVTLWHDASKFLDYSQNNAIVTP